MMPREGGPRSESVLKKDSSVIDETRRKVVGIVNESRIPSNGYESTVGVYGGRLMTGSDGKLVFNMKGVISKADQFGDAILRTYDEHTLNSPMDLIKKHPRWFFKFLAAGTKRYRGTPEEIVTKIHNLGLDEYYGPHPDGIEVKQPSVLENAVALQDIFRADQIGSARLQKIDRFSALANGARYIRDVHARGVGIGEVLPSDILFQGSTDEGAVSDPFLNIPDIVYTEQMKSKGVGKQQSPDARLRDQKATDLLDFIFSIGVEELRRSNDWGQVRYALDTIIQNYAEINVLKWVASFAKRGRLTLVGDKSVMDEKKQPDAVMNQMNKVFVQHNRARTGAQTGVEGTLRETIIQSCNAFLDVQASKS